MSEWLKEHAWKACVGETLPWVRIPLSPPINVVKLFPCRDLPCWMVSQFPLAPDVDSRHRTPSNGSSAKPGEPCGSLRPCPHQARAPSYCLLPEAVQASLALAADLPEVAPLAIRASEAAIDTRRRRQAARLSARHRPARHVWCHPSPSCPLLAAGLWPRAGRFLLLLLFLRLLLLVALGLVLLAAFVAHGGIMACPRRSARSISAASRRPQAARAFVRGRRR